MTDFEALADLAPTGEIRAAINLGNAAMARMGTDGTLTGRSVDLAKNIGLELQCPLVFKPYQSAGAVVAAVGSGDWDIAFLARDPARAATIHFTSPYFIIETSYVVRTDSEFTVPQDVDCPGVKIASSRGAAYDLHLQRTLQHATLIAYDDPKTSLIALLDGKTDCAAGVREGLEIFAAHNVGYRVLTGRITTVEQTVATPIDRSAGAAYLDRFMARWLQSVAT